MTTIFVIFVIFALAISAAEEIERKKTVKKSSAVDSKIVPELRTEVPETEATTGGVVQESTLALVLGLETLASTTQQSTTKTAATEVALSSATTHQPSTAPSTTTTKTAVEETDLSGEAAAANFPTLVTEVKPDATSTSETDTFVTPDNDGQDSVSSVGSNNVIPLDQNPKRKVVYINQRQNGKLNVQLELSDVSVIVIPNQKDPQLSLLNLLFKSAQKSNEKKDENESNDQYSKYKLQSVRPVEENYNYGSSNMPLVESRAPYKVDISSTMGQQSQPAVDISPNGHHHSIPQQRFQPQFARSPIMQLLKPIPFTIHPGPGQIPQSNRIFKRSTGSRMLVADDDIPGGGENSVNDELTESIFNNFDNNDDLNDYGESERSEFVLLGATENCGPGRRRNSYQICISDPSWEEIGWE